jgi:endonuclease IV
MILGAHVHTKGGLYNGISIVEELGCQAIQIFTKSPNRWVGVVSKLRCSELKNKKKEIFSWQI